MVMGDRFNGEMSRFRPYTRPPDVLTPDGLPTEHFVDRYSRLDELMVVQVNLLREISAKLGITIPIPGGNGTGNPTQSERIKNLRVAVVPFPVADTEVPYVFAIGTKSFLMHSRSGNEIRMSTQQGIVAANPVTISQDPHFTLKANTVYNQDDLNIRDFTQTFYFACSTAGEVLEIIIGV